MPDELGQLTIGLPDGVKTISVTMHLENADQVREAAGQRRAETYHLPYDCVHAKWIGTRYEVGRAEVTLLAPLGDR